MSKDVSGPRVLVVEDDPVQAFLVREALAGSGFAEIRIASTAREASEQLAAWTPELLVLDLGLPDGDGLAILQFLRSTGATVPILVVTADADPERRVRALELGADDLVTKPFNLLELGVRAQRTLRTHDHLRAADVLAQSLALELAELSEELELNHVVAVEMLVSSLSLRSRAMGTRARRVSRSVHQLAVAVHLDDVAEHLGHAASCHEIGALTLSDRDLEALVRDEPAAGAQCAVASEMILADRHVLAAAAAQFRAPGGSFDRQIQRLSAQLTAVCHTFHAAAQTITFDPAAGVAAVLGAGEHLDLDLAEAFLAVCVPATMPLD